MNTGELYIVETLKSFKGLKSNAEKALEQLSETDFHIQPDPESNSESILMQHMAGNMISRFTDFLTSDGEKPDRNRDGEFIDQSMTKEQLYAFWEKGWACVFNAMDTLKPDSLDAIVYIRNEEHTALRALNRQLTHYAYHCGQIIYLAKLIKGNNFRSLSIPKGKSAEFNVSTLGKSA